MRRAIRSELWAGLLALSLESCSRPPTVLVRVEDLPADTASLHVLPLHGGLGPHTELEPYDLPQPAPSRSTFLLRLPDSFVGDVTVAVGAYQGAGATSCLLATGSANLTELTGVDSTLRLPVVPVTDAICNGQRPLLLDASPKLGLIKGGDTIRLSGWGFSPGATAEFAGAVAKTTFVSGSQLDAVTPARVAIGPTTIKVSSKNGASHSRSDLFRYYADAIDLGPIPFNPNKNAQDVSDVIIGDFVPKDKTVAASLASTFRSANALSLVWAIPAQPIPTIGTNSVSFGPGSAPSSVAAADMNADGISDVIVALSGKDQVQVFLNDGLGNLTGQPPIAVGSQPEGVAAKDLNGDGKPDIVTANYAGSSLSVLLSLPTGGFLPAIALMSAAPGTDPPNPVSVVISDLNQDGWNDIAAVNQVGGVNQVNGNINLFLGLGLGAFAPKAVEMLVGVEPTQIAAIDTNRDGVDDFLVANRTSNNIQVLVNRTKKSGNINFDTFTLDTDISPESMSFSDMNGDGVTDLLVACSVTNTVNVFLNRAPDGLRSTTAQKFKMPGPPVCDGVRRLAAMDLITDGQMDLVGLCKTGGGLMKNQTL